MPYRKRTFRKRTYRKPRAAPRRFKARVRRVVQTITEHKRVEYTAISLYSSIGASWVENDLASVVVQGTSNVGHRIGAKIGITSFHVKGTIYGGAVGGVTADDLYNTIRMAIYTTKNQTGGSVVNPLLSSSPAITQHTPIRKENVKGLTRVYRDKFMTFQGNPVDADTAAPQGRNIDLFLKFKRPIVVTYDAASGVYHNDVHLYLSFISDSGSIPNPGFTTGWITLNYIDL